MTNAVFEASVAHDKARQLPPCRPERVEEVLWDWALNYDDLDLTKVISELRYLFHEQDAETMRKEITSGNEG